MIIVKRKRANFVGGWDPLDDLVLEEIPKMARKMAEDPHAPTAEDIEVACRWLYEAGNITIPGCVVVVEVKIDEEVA